MMFAGGNTELGVLAGSGPLLGDSAGAVYRENRSPLSGSEAFLLFTDGLVKLKSRDGEPFGERRLQRVLTTMSERSAREIRESVLTALAAYRDNAAPADDLSLVVVRSSRAR
jgi:serine phosphatase RsbU (regulator of sigma subunit)